MAPKDTASEALKQIKQFPQTQAPLNEQLYALYGIANKLGFYDAADFLKRFQPRQEYSPERQTAPRKMGM